MSPKLLLGTLGILAFASNVSFAQQADEKGWYGGLSIGQSKVEFSDSVLPIAGATATSLSKDETDTAFKIYAGYRFHTNFAVEGGWMNLGEFAATRNMTAPALGSLRATIESTGWNIDAVGILPLGTFSLFGKLGGIYTTTETNSSTSGAVILLPGVNANPEHSEFNFKWGAGGSFRFTRNWAVRAEFERVMDVGNSDTGEGDVDVITVGVVFHF